jgi:lipopolysaccharide export system protein LptA
MRFALALLLGCVAAGTASAQIGPAPTGRCALQASFDRITSVSLPSGQRNSFLGGNVVARCPSQNLVLKSDSLEAYGDEGRFYFVGHVDYSEPRLKLTSDYLTYFQREERLLAFLNVDAKLPTGSTLKGNQLEYLRAVPPIRTKQQATAVSRPTITVVERDSAGKPQPPVNITGNTIFLDGDSTVIASGEVVVVRPELTATGDSLYLDGGAGLLRMMRKPKIVGTKGRPFTLVGETIDLLSRRKKLERVLSKKAAEATSEDMNLKSDTIELRVTDDLLQRAISWGPTRAHATSPTQTIVADSIDVSLPGQRLREMHAVRGASAEGLPDTMKVHTKERDRLTGDTIVAHFDSLALRDSASKPQIRRLVAESHATSLQHIPARDTTVKLPAIVYVRGRQITATFDSSQVKTVVVVDPDQATGVYLEPNADSTSKARKAATDSTARAAPRGGAAAGAAPKTPTAPGPPARTPVAPVPAPAPTPTTPVKRP